MRQWYLILLVCLGVLNADGLEEALGEAERMHLSEDRYWHILLHMPDGASEIDDPRFFLATQGKSDAKAELTATLEALYRETRFDDNATGCRFPARRAWLRSTLSLDDLPPLQCAEYDALLERMDPQSVTLVFPSAHINSPASMFGHTFLRIDSSYDSKMLSYAVNYAAGADPDKENGMLFALKGLFGGYPGFYSLLPYYEKLKEYRDSEQRDIWEYDLNLTHDEVLAMVRHIWELRGVYNWYFFFDENCSYNMLWLLEAARPEVDLRRHFFYQVIPMETVHAVLEEGLVDEKHYRASKRTLLLSYEAVLNAESRGDVAALVEGRLSPRQLPVGETRSEQTARYTLEAASELAQYRFIKGELARPEYLKRYHAILSARSELGSGVQVPVARPINPEEGHRAMRAALRTGWREGAPVQMVGFRPAYHDLADSDVGFLRGTQIEFLDLLARYDAEGVAVEKATLLSIVSLVPRSAFFTPFSWRMHVGWDQSHYTRKPVFHAAVGAGYAFGGRWGYGYAMVDPEGYAGREAEAAVKGSAGVVFFPGGGSKLTAEGGYRMYHTGRRQWEGRAVKSFRSSQNSAFKFMFEYREKERGVERTFTAGFDVYF